MAAISQQRQYEPAELFTIFMGSGEPEVPENEREDQLQENAIRIAKTGAGGTDFLLAFAPYADEARLRAILLAMVFVAKKLSAHKRASVCELAQRLLSDKRPMVVAEAVDTLWHLGCREATKSVSKLLDHRSPFVVGSALRFFARCAPDKAVPLLEKALKSAMPIVRQNAIDELDEMNYKPALAKIKRLLEDPDQDVRQAASTAVAHLENDSL